ncbi:MAG: hypothetical protein CL532_00835 [Aestuariivita sp.]|nr:hypothetical protein [Aestuariivita sp.]
MITDVYYINLDYRPDRKENMELTLPILGLPVTRFEAIRPTQPDIVTGKYKEYYARSIGRIRNYLHDEKTYGRAYGIFGVYLSQLEIHKSRIGKEGDYIIIEDDAIISPETAAALSHLVNCMPSDWDMLRNIWSDEADVSMDLHKFIHCHQESRFADKYSHGRYGGAHFSVCKGSSAERIVNYLNEDYFYAIDSAYSTNQLHVYHANLGVTIGDYGTDIPKDEHEPPPNPYGPICYVP